MLYIHTYVVSTTLGGRAESNDGRVCTSDPGRKECFGAGHITKIDNVRICDSPRLSAFFRPTISRGVRFLLCHRLHMLESVCHIQGS